MQELEARLRQCELQGIEASSEIQMAARQVADENKKLRILLAQHGVTDDSIEAYLHGSSSPTADMIGSPPGPSSGSVQVLERLLQTRKAVRCTDHPTPTQVPSESQDSLASAITVQQSLWEPLYAPGLALQASQTVAPTHHFMTPSTSSSSQTSHGHTSHQQTISSISTPRSPSSNPSSQSQHQHLFEFDLQTSASQKSSVNKYLQPHPGAQRSSLYVTRPIRNTNVNNCNYATDMITAMNGADPDSVRAELGCLPGTHCDVDNHRLFEVMDRYSDVGI